MGCDLYRASPGFTGKGHLFLWGVEAFIKCRSFWMFCKLCILFSDDDDDDYKTKLVYIYCLYIQTHIMYARCDYSCCCCCCYIIPYSLWFSPPIYIIYMYLYIYTVHITDLFIYIVTSWLLLTVRCVLMSILGFCRVAGPCLGQGCPVLQISISLSRLQWLQPPCLLINHSTCGSAVLSVVYSYTQE